MKSGFWYLRALGPLPPPPTPLKSNACNRSSGGNVQHVWVGSVSKVAPWQPNLQHPTSIIPSFNYFTSSFFFLLLFDIPIVQAKFTYICLFKGSGSRKWIKCWCGPRPRPGKGGEPWCCWGGNVPRQREGGFLRLQVWQRHSQFLWCFSEIYLFYISIIFSYLFG